MWVTAASGHVLSHISAVICTRIMVAKRNNLTFPSTSAELKKTITFKEKSSLPFRISGPTKNDNILQNWNELISRPIHDVWSPAELQKNMRLSSHYLMSSGASPSWSNYCLRYQTRVTLSKSSFVKFRAVSQRTCLIKKTFHGFFTLLVSMYVAGYKL